MTYDDGILTICQTANIGEKGMKPVIGLVEKEKFYFGYDTLGFRRYYTALQAHQTIESVVNIPGWNDISALDICVMEDGRQYKLAMIQPTTDENGLKITKLSLERLGENYVFKDPEDQGSPGRD